MAKEIVYGGPYIHESDAIKDELQRAAVAEEEVNWNLFDDWETVTQGALNLLASYKNPHPAFHGNFVNNVVREDDENVENELDKHHYLERQNYDVNRHAPNDPNQNEFDLDSLFEPSEEKEDTEYAEAVDARTQEPEAGMAPAEPQPTVDVAAKEQLEKEEENE